VPAEAIVGLWPREYDFWTQVEQAGYINDPRIEVPRGAYVPQPVPAYSRDCIADATFFDLAPQIKPAYLVSLDPGQCGGQAAFPPVAYHTWIAPHTNWVYALKLPPDLLR
jgi:hypothetical protein